MKRARNSLHLTSNYNSRRNDSSRRGLKYPPGTRLKCPQKVSGKNVLYHQELLSIFQGQEKPRRAGQRCMNRSPRWALRAGTVAHGLPPLGRARLMCPPSLLATVTARTQSVTSTDAKSTGALWTESPQDCPVSVCCGWHYTHDVWARLVAELTLWASRWPRSEEAQTGPEKRCPLPAHWPQRGVVKVGSSRGSDLTLLSASSHSCPRNTL